jgi:hypothetical protein
MENLECDVLVVGGGTGGTAAAIQSARRGVRVILASEFEWLGGMLTAAGVPAPDGNELDAFRTGLWGAFLKELHRRQKGGLDHGWVSFFTYHPRVGAEIFADWVATLPNLRWISGQVPLAVNRMGDRLSSVHFENYHITATIIIDGTELGDLLALAEVPYRWGWELHSAFHEPSVPASDNPLTLTYPVQTPTWVVMMRDFGEQAQAPVIPPPSEIDLSAFEGCSEGYSPEQFLNYGRLPGDRLMINWPQKGNDYGDRLHRLVESSDSRREFFQEALNYSHAFAHVIQTKFGQRYGLATDMFPHDPMSIGGGAFALCPYIRESRRLVGLTTIQEQDILPQANGQVAPLPINDQGRCEAIALGNYPNDHHYPAPASNHLTLTPKAIRWGGRWTGTPFTIPYRSLIPDAVDGLLVCDKNLSVSHIANGATRLQPIVLGIGQAAGMAAALCVDHHCQPRDLPVEALQEALLTDAIAPSALVPLFNADPCDPSWIAQQRHYINYPETYPANGYGESQPLGTSSHILDVKSRGDRFTGLLQSRDAQSYLFTITFPEAYARQQVNLVTLNARVNMVLQRLPTPCTITVFGQVNGAGAWIRVSHIQARDDNVNALD